MQETKALIQKAMAGDVRAFRLIVEEHQAFAYAVAFRMLGQEDEAEDVVQEAFVRLWKNLPKYREEIKITTWLYRIITNLCLDYVKSVRGRQKKNQDALSVGKSVHAITNPAKEMEQRELMVLVQEAAAALTPKQKAVFVLRDLQGLDVQEVCSILEMEETQVKSNLYHARLAISRELKEQYQTDKPNEL